MSASSSGPCSIRSRPERDARNTSSAPAYDRASRSGRLGGVAPLEAEPFRNSAGDVRVVEGECALDAGAEDRDVVPVAPRNLGHRGEIEQ